MSINSDAYLIQQTLQRPTAINAAIYGSFSAPKVHEIIVAHGHSLELLRPDDSTGKLRSIHQTDIFGIVRSVQKLRFFGSLRDYLVVGSDSGRISILQYHQDRFVKIHEETYGKSGCRRAIAGQMVAVDPLGRAVMIAAIERQRFVYLINRDAQQQLTISSPLEAHTPHTINLCTVALDVGFNNPIFACLEIDHDQPVTSEQIAAAHPCPQQVPSLPSNVPHIPQYAKQLVFYELDIGLNQINRKFAAPIGLWRFLGGFCFFLAHTHTLFFFWR